MAKVNVVIVDATGNKEQKVGLPDDIKCGIIMVKLVEKIKLPSVGPDGNPISYKFIHKVTGRQLLESQTLAEAGIKDGDVLRLQPEITAGAFCDKCGAEIKEGDTFCPSCGNSIGQPEVDAAVPQRDFQGTLHAFALCYGIYPRALDREQCRAALASELCVQHRLVRLFPEHQPGTRVEALAIAAVQFYQRGGQRGCRVVLD